MKLSGIAASMAVMLFASVASAQSTWPDDAVWGVDEQNQVFRWDLHHETFEQMPGAMKQVSVGNDGEVWGIDPADDVFRWTGSEWQRLGQQKLSQLSVRNGQEAWGVNAANDVFRWNGSSWEPQPFQLDFVAAGVDGTVWGIQEGALVELATRADPSVSIHPISSTPNHLTRIVVSGNSRPYHDAWAIDDNAQLFYRLPTVDERWEKVDGTYIDVGPSPRGNLWRLTSDGSVFFSVNPAANPDSVPRVIPMQPMDPSRHLKQIAVGSRYEIGLTTAERNQILDTHNRERRNYPGVGDLQWSYELERYAQEWAQRWADAGQSGHRSDTRDNPFKPGEWVGENMYYGGPGWGLTGVNAIEWFISEKQWYHHDDNTCSAPQGQACGHFTQVVWKNSQYVGCGEAIANNFKYYVCNYYPAGNNGQRPY